MNNYLTSDKLILSDLEKVTIDFTWEILFGCSEKCEGCYVNKFDKDTLADQNKSIDFLWNQLQTYKLNEWERYEGITLGPTDIMNCVNIIPLTKNSKFVDILKTFNSVAVTGSFLTKDKNINEFIEWKNRLIPEQEIEYIVSFDIKNLLESNVTYINTVKETIHKISSNILGKFSYALTLNMKDYEISESEYYTVQKILRDEFNVTFELNPSFFRTHNKTTILKTINIFNSLFNSFNDTDNVSVHSRNVSGNEFSFYSILIKGTDMYTMPFIYDDAVLMCDSLRVDENYMPKFNINNIQSNYIQKTDECKNCDILASCMGRKVLSLMEYYSITECIIPKKLIYKEIYG